MPFVKFISSGGQGWNDATEELEDLPETLVCYVSCDFAHCKKSWDDWCRLKFPYQARKKGWHIGKDRSAFCDEHKQYKDGCSWNPWGDEP